MWFAVQRSKLLAFGGAPDRAVMGTLHERLKSAVAFATGAGEILRDNGRK